MAIARDKLQIFESTPFLAADWLKETVRPYIESYSTKEPSPSADKDSPIKHRNAIHAALTFHRGASMDDAVKALDRFINLLALHTGLYRGRIWVVGVLIEAMEAPFPGLPSEPAYHCHLIAKSPKARRTGRTVARIKEHHPAIAEGLADTLQSFTAEPVFDLPGLISYINGSRNLKNPLIKKVWKISQIGG